MGIIGEFNIKIIRKLILKGKWLLSDHAMERLVERKLRVVDVVTSILNGEILEDYPEDSRGHSVLVLGKKDDTYIHTVCGLREGYLVIITAYIPEPPKWIDERTRGGGKAMNKCMCCEGELVKKRVRVEKWVNERLIIIENVPALVCEECGEKYYDAETSLKLDEYFYETKPDKVIEVPVFEYREGR